MGAVGLEELRRVRIEKLPYRMYRKHDLGRGRAPRATDSTVEEQGGGEQRPACQALWSQKEVDSHTSHCSHLEHIFQGS